jgi:catechol 2,3-dioxygenase-like lactoylglutathione lyase family enzyme
MLVAYAMLGTADHAKAMTLYTPVMEVLGAKKIDAYSHETRTWFGRDGAGMLSIGHPLDDTRPASGGNGTMVGLLASDRAMVDAAHAKALELGATDEGAPGVRGGGGLYIAYFRDHDGNKIAMFTMSAT